MSVPVRSLFSLPSLSFISLNPFLCQHFVSYTRSIQLGSLGERCELSQRVQVETGAFN